MAYHSFDVFLSHSSQDKAVVRAIAERLRADGVRVWSDDEGKVEDGLEQSRVLVLCMSANAFRAAEWARIEAETFRFRDPSNEDRRFVPLRLDDAPIKGWLAQLLYIGGREYAKLLDACRPPKTKELTPEQEAASERLQEKIISLGHTDSIRSVAFSPDGLLALSGSDDHTVRLWDVETGRAVRVLEGHSGRVLSVCPKWAPSALGLR